MLFENPQIASCVMLVAFARDTAAPLLGWMVSGLIVNVSVA